MLPSAWGGGGAPRDDGDNTVRVWWVLGTQSCLLQPDGRTAALPPGPTWGLLTWPAGGVLRAQPSS